jgi:hypothetical protein
VPINNMPRPEGAIEPSGVEAVDQIDADHKYLPPLQGGTLCGNVPGVKTPG